MDTPDTNTTPENQRLLAQVLEAADLLLAVFPAQNPKLMDNIAFLAPYVGRLPAEAVVPVLNMVDRVPEDQLINDVLPDFGRAIQSMWRLPEKRVYAVSGRAALPGSHFEEDEAPLHDRNEFDALRRLVYERLNRAGQAVDRRLARGEHLLDDLRSQIGRALATAEPARKEAADALADIAAESRTALQGALAEQLARRGGLDVQAALYGRLATRWWGPVGWLVVLWSLLVRAGSWVGRFGRRDGGRRLGATVCPALPPGGYWAEALQRIGADRWPPVGDALVRVGFAPAARESVRWQESVAQAGREVARRATPLLSARLDRAAGRLAALWLQLLLNLPVVGLAAWVGYETVRSFFEGRYLSADYFRQAGIAILVVWLAAFLLAQGIVSLSARRALRRGLADDLAEVAIAGLVAGWRQELDALDTVGDLVNGATRL